jgi:hypothetical protein
MLQIPASFSYFQSKVTSASRLRKFTLNVEHRGRQGVYTREGDKGFCGCSIASARGCKAGYILGSVVLAGYEDINASNITPELAADCGLTYEALLVAYHRGYRTAWLLADAAPFETPVLANKMYSKGRVAVVWTNCHTAPIARMVGKDHLRARVAEILLQQES